MNPNYDLLLVGAGHAHLGVLRLWAKGQRPAGRIGLISSEPDAWYSGMLPGLLAGRYAPQQCRIALQPLCAASGIEFIHDELYSLQADNHCLQLSAGRQLKAQWLSLNLGSQPQAPQQMDAGMQVLPVKPFAGFIEQWQRWQQQPQPMAILGGGAAGVELALALADQVPALTLISGSKILSGHAAGLRRRALPHLQRASLHLLEDCPTEQISNQRLLSGGQSIWQGARVILATGASALPCLRDSGLVCDANGFIAINNNLQSQSHPQIFAVGDCASLPGAARSGVYAVRQGPVLAVNLSRALRGQALTTYTPQQRALALLADGQGGALLSWAGLSAQGQLLGRWKDYLDQRFIAQHSVSAGVAS